MKAIPKETITIERNGYKLTNHRVQCRRGVIWLGQTCNLLCRLCFFSDRIADSKHPEHAFMSLEKAKKICKTLVDVYGNNAVDIQGGEPTIFPKIYDLVSYCAEIGLKPTLITNALVLDRFSVGQKLLDAGIFDLLISVHALGKSYDHLVQVPGASARQTKALDNLKKVGIPFRFNTVLSKEAIPQLMDIARIAKQSEARVVNFIAYNPFIDQAAENKRSVENIPRYQDVAKQLLPVIDYLDSHMVEVNVRYLPFCIFPEKYRKFVQNFQQIVYDLHEWESASEVWSSAGPQRHSLSSISIPINFFDRIGEIRETNFREAVNRHINYPPAVDRLLAELKSKFEAEDKLRSRVAFFGNPDIGKKLADILSEHSYWRSRWEMYGYISSQSYHKANRLNDAPWYRDDQLAVDPPDIIITTTETFISQIHEIIEQYGLLDRTLDYFGNHECKQEYQPIFYLDEMGEIDGFKELDYAYKEYRIWMAKTMHPYSKGEKCKQCALIGICDGIHRDYAELFGFSEVVPTRLPEKVYDPQFYMAKQLKVVEMQEYDWAMPIIAQDYMRMQRKYYD